MTKSNRKPRQSWRHAWQRRLTLLGGLVVLLFGIGLLIGHFGESVREEQVWDRVLEIWDGDGFPIWGRAPIGHGTSNHMLPIGLPAVLNSAQRSITFPYE